MLTSTLGLRSTLTNLINPSSLTLTLIPSDDAKSRSSPPPSSSSPKTTTQDDPSPKALAIISLLSGTVGLAAMSAVQSLAGYLLLLSLFGSAGASTYMKEFLRADVSGLTPAHIADRAVMARDTRYAWIFLPLFTTFSVALPEELLKYLPAVWVARRRRQQQTRTKDGRVVWADEERAGRVLLADEKRTAVRAATAASLGFAAVELAAYVHAASSSHASGGTGPSAAVTLLERIFIALPGHLATAILSASRGADTAAAASFAGNESSSGQWRTVLDTIAPSVVYHALFDFILIGSSALVGGHVGWVHPQGWRAVLGTLGACVLVQGWLYAHTAWSWLGWGKGTNQCWD